MDCLKNRTAWIAAALLVLHTTGCAIEDDSVPEEAEQLDEAESDLATCVHDVGWTYMDSVSEVQGSGSMSNCRQLEVILQQQDWAGWWDQRKATCSGASCARSVIKSCSGGIQSYNFKTIVRAQRMNYSWTAWKHSNVINTTCVGADW